MANKNTAGSLVARANDRIDRFIDKIDRRSKSGEDRENVDHVWQKHTVTEEGDRVWSF
jgi:hypothetical protein